MPLGTMISFEDYMCKVLGDDWAVYPDALTDDQRKVQDLHSRYQSVPMTELESILREAGGDVAAATTVLHPMDVQAAVRAKGFGMEKVAALSAISRAESTAVMSAMSPAQRACTLACMAPRNFILTPEGAAFGVECTLCEEPMCHTEFIQELRPCGHFFHVECLASWILTEAAIKQQCPDCRQPFKDRSSALAAMSSSDRAATLAAMPFGDRGHSAEEFGARLVANLMTMPPEERRDALVVLSSVDRAATLAAMSPEDEASSLAVMDIADRASSLALILAVIHPTSRLSRLDIMSPEERAATLAALSPAERASTMAALTREQLKSITGSMLATPLLPWLHDGPQAARRPKGAQCCLIRAQTAEATALARSLRDGNASSGSGSRPQTSLVEEGALTETQLEFDKKCPNSGKFRGVVDVDENNVPLDWLEEDSEEERESRPGTAVYDERQFETRLLTPLSQVFQLDMFVKGLDDDDMTSSDDDHIVWSDSDEDKRGIAEPRREKKLDRTRSSLLRGATRRGYSPDDPR